MRSCPNGTCTQGCGCRPTPSKCQDDSHIKKDGICYGPADKRCGTCCGVGHINGLGDEEKLMEMKSNTAGLYSYRPVPCPTCQPAEKGWDKQVKDFMEDRIIIEFSDLKSFISAQRKAVALEVIRECEGAVEYCNRSCKDGEDDCTKRTLDAISDVKKRYL